MDPIVLIVDQNYLDKLAKEFTLRANCATQHMEQFV